MTGTITITPKEAQKLIVRALVGAGTLEENARYFTKGILDTELSGLTGHGFFWVPWYCEHVRTGKVDGRAKPKISKLSGSAFRVDARHGFAHPAIEKGFDVLIPAARKRGIAAMGVYNSYNAATLGFHTGHLARSGLVALGFTNSPPAIAPPGGKVPVIGTNPFSFAVPGPKNTVAFLIDQSSSAVAKTAVMTAAAENRQIPLGWALDKEGEPTTDPHRALEGSMAPFGGYKGFGQGLFVEVMCGALAGGLLGTQMGSFTDGDERPVDCGQFFIAIEPEMMSGGIFRTQVRRLIKSILAQEGARLPNARREENIKRLRKMGLTLDRALYERIRSYWAD
jgi:(2R)-3-sulfolactate dehydrogenase (NADP+)